jgi:hypothetical protein
VLGVGGNKKDATLLIQANEDEPNADVRREFERSIRRLTIGDRSAAHERLGELVQVDDPAAWVLLDPLELYGGWGDGLVKQLNKVAQAESDHRYGDAIDAVDEVAKILLFRAIEVAGDDSGLGEKVVAKVAANAIDYGAVLGMQQFGQTWKWSSFFESLHELRDVHVTPKGSKEPKPAKEAKDWTTALSLFRLGGRHAASLIASRS